MNNWIEISGTALASNFHALQQAAGESTEVLAVVKANAYGHGAERCASILVQAGAQWLGVTCAAEGERVRAAVGDAAKILLMSGFLPGDLAAIQAMRLTPVLWTAEQAGWLSQAPGLPVHVEVDTGMGRQGVSPGPALDRLLKQIRAAGLVLDGIFTHFSSSEVVASPLTLQQQQRFASAVAQVRSAGLAPRWIHAGNSSTVDNPTQPGSWLTGLARSVHARAMVRTGIALYGFCLPLEDAARPQATGGFKPPAETQAEAQIKPQIQPQLQPVMRWLARVLAVRDLTPGETVGYNATYTAPHSMRVALLPVGYADGLRRELSSTTLHPGGWAILAGQRAPILGRVSMNLTVVDVSRIQGVAPGDIATILGHGISAQDHARLAGTIVYEIVCGIHPCG